LNLSQEFGPFSSISLPCSALGTDRLNLVGALDAHSSLILPAIESVVICGRQQK
jgi:hypothetical protein